jgi:hypothetical protein
MELELTKAIRYERMVLSRLYRRSIKTNNLPIKSLCGERIEALVCFMVDYEREYQLSIKT